MRRFVYSLLVILCACLLANASAAQPAGLVADRVFIDPAGRVVADGNVLVVQGERTLSASRVVYDPETERVSVNGPILITEPDGEVVQARAAELDAGFETGIIEGARLILDEQVQIAASRITRADPNVTAADQVVATSCRVCSGRPPIWQIRARRVVLDEERQRLWFDNARLEVVGQPVFWWPILSLPEPGVDRASGFLFPSIRSNTITGTGIRLPYFIPLGDHADITLTPMLTTQSRTLEARYRQAFVGGELEINGALTNDDIDNTDTRAYIFIDGRQSLPADFDLTYIYRDASDRSYLSDYGFTNLDRLRSTIRAERANHRNYIIAEGNYFFSQREDEIQELTPSLFADLRYGYYQPLAGGMARIAFEAHHHNRGSDTDQIGRDISRAAMETGWTREQTVGLGFRFGSELALAFDYIDVNGDSRYPKAETQATPSAAMRLSWPLLRNGPNGNQLLEPFAQLAWSGGDRLDVPNEESLRATLDEGNMLAFSRFPASDRRERGLNSSTGLRWEWQTADGPSWSVVGARLWREKQDAAFTDSSGLASGRETYLLSLGANDGENLNATARAVWDSDVVLAKAEARLSWTYETGDVTGSYVQLREDDAEGRSVRIEEISLELTQELTPFWTVQMLGRYDLAAERPTRIAGELTYRNECVALGLAASRRFSTSGVVDESTEFGLTLDLLGFGLPGQTGATRQCDS